MGCTSNLVDQAQNPRRKARKAVGAISDRAAKLAEFEAFGDEIRLELDPTGALERLLTDYVTQVAWRLKTAIERQEDREVDAFNPEAGKSSRIRPTAIEAAARIVREAFAAFEVCRALTKPRTTSAFVVDLRSEPEVVSPVVENLEPSINEEEITHWRDRLSFDFEVSDISPVVKGTWVTVGHVVSLIVDGWTWADILRSHPELSEDDIRSCVNYAMDEENDPGNPEI